MLDWDRAAARALPHRLGTFSRLIRFDKRGTGMSDRPGGLPDLETRMDDVLAVMDAAGRERAVLFGYSEGGPMSILFAASYPERVARAGPLLQLCAAAAGLRTTRGASDPRSGRGTPTQLEQDWAWEADMRHMCPNADEELARWWGERCRAATSPARRVRSSR